MIVSALMMLAIKLDVNAGRVPSAKKVPVVREIHGDTFIDVFAWFRNLKDPDLLPYLKANNVYSDAVMKPTVKLQQKLYKEMVARIQETDLSVPTFDRGYFYYTRSVKGKQYEIHCRRKGSMKAKEQILLDVNVLAKGKPFTDVGAFEISPNGHLLAYSLDSIGHRDYLLYFKDLRKGKVLPYRFGQVNQVTWMADNKTVLYTSENAAKRTYRLNRRALGGNAAKMLYEEKDEMYDLSLGEGRDHKYAFIYSGSKETTEYRTISLDKPLSNPVLIASRKEGVEYYPEHRDGTFYIRTNAGAPEFRIVSVDARNPDPDNWVDVLPQQPNATIEGLDVFKKFAIVQIRKNAVAGLNVLDFESRKLTPIKFPDAYYSTGVGSTPDFNAKKVRLSYVSLITPSTTYDYDPLTRKLGVLKRQKVNGYNPAQYTSELLWISARDSVKVPIAIAYRKGVKKPSPMLLEAYGAYGAPNDPFFSTSQLSLLDRGVICASALIRGGGEMGEKWHDSGKMAAKITTFTDFIDCARALQKLGYTTKQRLAITGGSAGGLTMGAVLNMAPDLSRIALVHVPFVDVVNTMLDETIPLTTQEFIEWGNPKIEEQYRWIRSYSPYDNVGALDYPAMLVRTSLNDSQVPYWEAAKWVARLRELRSDKDPLFLKINLDAGHGGSSGRYDSFRERAYDFAFLLAMFGVDN